MNKIENKNIFFFSHHPKDTINRQFLQELEKNKLLDDQFIKVCVYPNMLNINIPRKILELNKIPVLVAAGFPKPILGEDALSWLRNNTFNNDKTTNLDYGNIYDTSFSSKYANLDDEFKANDYNQFHNSEYNLGFSNTKNNSINNFSELKDDTRIITDEDSQGKKKGHSDEITKKLNQLQQQRNSEMQKRPIGGLFEANPNQRPNDPFSSTTPMDNLNNPTATTNIPNLPNNMMSPPPPSNFPTQLNLPQMPNSQNRETPFQNREFTPVKPYPPTNIPFRPQTNRPSPSPSNSNSNNYPLPANMPGNFSYTNVNSLPNQMGISTRNVSNSNLSTPKGDSNNMWPSPYKS